MRNTTYIQCWGALSHAWPLLPAKKVNYNFIQMAVQQRQTVHLNRNCILEIQPLHSISWGINDQFQILFNYYSTCSEFQKMSNL